MKCPYCKNIDTKVINSRTMDDNTAIRRRRMCEKCRDRFTTYERVDTIPIAVIKRDQTRETFDRIKLLDGIVKSCNKRPVSMQQIENIVNEIEGIVSNSLRKEITSNEIGELAMLNLRKIDEIAYVRFASVYKQFKDIGEFMEELSALGIKK